MACSHWRRRRDKTVLSCLVCSCVHTANATRQDSFVMSPTVFTPPTQTRQNSSKLGQDKTKLSCRWCEQAIMLGCIVHDMSPGSGLHQRHPAETAVSAVTAEWTMCSRSRCPECRRQADQCRGTSVAVNLDRTHPHSSLSTHRTVVVQHYDLKSC